MLNTTNTDQMELDFEMPSVCRSLRCNSKESRTEWWFKQMRRVVEMAIEWQPAPAGRSEQGYLLQ